MLGRHHPQQQIGVVGNVASQRRATREADTPGNRGFSRLACNRGGRRRVPRHQRDMCPPAAAWSAKAVPQAPAPTTATLLIDQPDQRWYPRRLRRAKPFQDRVGDRAAWSSN